MGVCLALAPFLHPVHTVCKSSEAYCVGDGQCIPSERWCDGIIIDCSDESDELDCGPASIGMQVNSRSVTNYENSFDNKFHYTDVLLACKYHQECMSAAELCGS